MRCYSTVVCRMKIFSALDPIAMAWFNVGYPEKGGASVHSVRTMIAEEAALDHVGWKRYFCS